MTWLSPEQSMPTSPTGTQMSSCRFGPFRLDMRNRILHKGLSRIRLSHSLMRLLMLFVTRVNKLVTREEIAALLWQQPGAVDVTNGINTAVNRLRTALGDDSLRPVYIETMVGAGYRFIASVEWDEALLENVGESIQASRNELAQAAGNYAAPPLQPAEQHATLRASSAPAEVLLLEELDSQSPASKVRSIRARVSIYPLFGATLITLVAVLVWVAHRSQTVRSNREPLAPVLQPFAQATFNKATLPITASSVSPDGRMLAFSDASGLAVRLLERGSDIALALPKALHVSRIAWQRDNSGLVVSCEDMTGATQVWSVPLAATTPILLLQDGAEGIPSPDGKQVAFTRHNGSEIWLATLLPNAAHKLLDGSGTGRFSSLLWSAEGEKLYAEERQIPEPLPYGAANHDVKQDYRWYLICLEADTAKILSRQESPRWTSAALLGDDLIFLRDTRTDTHMAAQLQAVATQGLAGELSLSPRLSYTFDQVEPSSLSASLDGKVAVVLDRSSPRVSTAHLVLPSGKLTNLKELAHEGPNNFPHGWTPSGDAVIFESNATGEYAIYKQRVDGSKAELMARTSANSVLPKVTPDGRWILFDDYASIPVPRIRAIYRVPLAGGRMERVATSGPIDGFDCSLSAEGRCALRARVGKQFVYYDLDAVHGQGRELARTDWTESWLGDWSLSSDGNRVVTVTHDPAHPGIHFVPISPQSGAEFPNITVPGMGNVLLAQEVVRGKGFLVEVRLNDGYTLLFVDLKGHATSLRHQSSPLWAVPSRQGYIAFPAQVSDRNVWLTRISALN